VTAWAGLTVDIILLKHLHIIYYLFYLLPSIHAVFKKKMFLTIECKNFRPVYKHYLYGSYLNFDIPVVIIIHCPAGEKLGFSCNIFLVFTKN